MRQVEAGRSEGPVIPRQCRAPERFLKALRDLTQFTDRTPEKHVKCTLWWPCQLCHWSSISPVPRHQGHHFNSCSGSVSYPVNNFRASADPFPEDRVLGVPFTSYLMGIVSLEALKTAALPPFKEVSRGLGTQCFQTEKGKPELVSDDPRSVKARQQHESFYGGFGRCTETPLTSHSKNFA